ncbi:BQ5605_C062g12753 [Microbotryum silenes-dioicae]|uniref:BQ5605_C062g12753 protein n=1 Tax=Microbotryum silenes-dioicae TaxID=796604 RepID=A0A2X0NJ92_9BASI|nr:BQ5605_C062g12753 [Microbotryum silenes-dioicae]
MGAKGGYKATTASSWVKVKPLRAKSAAQIKTAEHLTRTPTGGEYCCRFTSQEREQRYSKIRQERLEKEGGEYTENFFFFVFFFFLTGAHKLQSFGLAGTATKRAKGGYKATTASSWVKVKPLRAKSAAQIKTRRAPNADSNGR